MWIFVAVAALGVVAFLYWHLQKRFAASQIEALLDKRRATSRMVSAAEFVEGNRHLQVALALTNADLFYENADMEASLDLRWIREIEYDTRLATGPAVEGGQVLRIRCVSQLFEFVLPTDVALRWQTALPARAAQDSSDGNELAMRVASAT